MGSLVDSFLNDFDAEAPPQEPLPQAAAQPAPQNRLAPPLPVPREKSLVEDARHQPLFAKLYADDDGSDHIASLNDLEQYNALLKEIDAEILALHNWVKDVYGRRFPELESLIQIPLDYLFVVKTLQNDLDLSAKNLGAQLSNACVLAVSVAASVSCGKPLTEEVMSEVMDVVERVDELVKHRSAVLSAIEKSMDKMAPNLTAVVGGPSLAARLITYAGGLKNLADMPSQNLLLLGGSSFARAHSAQVSTSGSAPVLGSTALGRLNYGVIFEADLVQSTIPAFRGRAMKLLAGKCALAVRKDMYNNDGTNAVGKQLREKAITSLAASQAPPPPKFKKPLPVPEERPKARRGGRRKRKLKEKYGMTEARKKQNRMWMTVEEGRLEELDEEENEEDHDLF